MAPLLGFFSCYQVNLFPVRVLLMNFLRQWCQLKQRKENLLKLFENMREFQLDKVMENPDAPIPDNMRLIKDEDIERYRTYCASQ